MTAKFTLEHVPTIDSHMPHALIPNRGVHFSQISLQEVRP